ncbi:MAG: hypothetical protein JNG86_01555 [Verrucomicrobiaceae bacterium]|nr:hypothetical protein [Verrucomicrobiaceae bacterium]
MESSTIQHVLFVAALVVFAAGCRSFDNRYIYKLGGICLLGALYLAGYYITDDQHLGGALFVFGWFLIPWMEIVFRVRRLRFPIKSEVTHRFPPSRDVFPDLNELSREVEDAGFVLVGDTGWMWSETEHFMRLFYHEEKRMQASVALARQGEMGFSYVSLTSRGKNGVVYTTSNYPFPATMKHPPKHLLNRYEEADSMEDLLADHEDFLVCMGLEIEDIAPQDTEFLHAYIQRDMSVQVDHNLTEGLIVKEGAGEFRYSWRGCLYLYWQVLKDMLRV